jgi:L-phenylalanine/L-methionine N-acetyltransferase
MTRPATVADFAFFYRLYMHPQINPFLLYEPMSEAEFEPIFADLLERKVLYVFEDEGKNTGMFKLEPNRTARLTSCIWADWRLSRILPGRDSVKK